MTDSEASSDEVRRKRTSKPTVDAKPNTSMYFAIGVAMVGAMMFGLDQGNFGNVQSFNSFREEWCLGRFGDEETCTTEGAKKNARWNDEFVMYGATLITFGAAAGALLLAPVISGKFGRRPCISTGGGITFVGCLMASYLSFHSTAIFYAGRFVTGFGVGVSCFALPVYNAEISTPSIRGATGSLFQLNVVIGGFIACITTLFVSDWQFGMILPGLAGFVLMVAAPFLPESARFVIEARGYDQAVKELKRVRSGDVTNEAAEMLSEVKAMESVKEVSYMDIVTQANLRKRVVIAILLVLAQQTTGVNAFLGYAATLFENCGIDNPILFNTIFNCIMIFGCIAGLLLVDSKYGGRRRQLLGATAIMGPPLILAGLALGYGWPGIITMVCVVIYGVGYQFAWGTIPWIYPAEIFSMSEKEKSVSLAVCFNYLANALIIMITPFMMTASVSGTLLFFGGLNILNAVFVFACIRETKGVPLEQIPALFQAGGAASSDSSSSDTDSEASSDA